jgi:hypothetical protein
MSQHTPRVRTGSWMNATAPLYQNPLTIIYGLSSLDGMRKLPATCDCDCDCDDEDCDCDTDCCKTS